MNASTHREKTGPAHLKPGEPVRMQVFVDRSIVEVYFNGEDITHMPMYQRARRGMGYLAQEPSVFRRLTVEQNLLAILETMKLTRQQRLNRARSLLADLELTDKSHQKADTLSGGERRRLEITRALVTNPALLLLDEPFSGIDPKAVSEIQEIIENLRERGIGILLTDHNVRDTLAITDLFYPRVRLIEKSFPHAKLAKVVDPLI